MTTETSDMIRARLKRLDAIPTIPTILRPLLHYLEKPIDLVEVDRIVDLVSCDKSIAAQCLHMANSALFGRSCDVETVRGAVVALGVSKLREILLSCCLLRLLPKEQWVLDPVVFWEHSFGCALVSRHLARKIRFASPERAYLAGLLHDLGELVNCVSLGEGFRAAAELAIQEQISLYEAERAMLGFTHCDTGHILAEQWKLPEEFRQVILYHHEVQQAKLHAALVTVVSLSDSFCRLRGLGYGFSERREVDFLEDPAWEVLIREYPHLNQVDLASFTIEMEGLTDEVRKLVAALFRG